MDVPIPPSEDRDFGKDIVRKVKFTPVENGDIFEISDKDGSLDAAQFLMAWFMNQNASMRVQIEVNGQVYEANAVTYAMENGKPLIRVSNR